MANFFDIFKIKNKNNDKKIILYINIKYFFDL